MTMRHRDRADGRWSSAARAALRFDNLPYLILALLCATSIFSRLFLMLR
jgi:hypothetical protein